MSDNLLQLLIALVGAVAIGGGSIFLLRSRRSDLEADTTLKISQSASDWIDKLEERINRLEERVRELEAERDRAHIETAAVERRNGRLGRWIKILEAQVIEHGGVPVRLDDIPD